MILAIDQGTTGTTCLVFNAEGELIAQATDEFTQHFPQPGWVEHDPEEIWRFTHSVAGVALTKAGVQAGELKAIGITNQRETVVVWDRQTGKPLHRALVWQDRRTAARCDQLKTEGYEQLIRERTGLVIDPYFSATKIEWLLDNVPGLRVRAERGEVVFGTIDAWLIYNLTGRAVTDPSNASRTMLYDIHQQAWDPELLEIFGIPEAALPGLVPSVGPIGETDPELFHGQRALVAGVAGDQQAALFGQACFREGDTKTTYGTGSFLLMNVGHDAPPLKKGLLTTVAWQVEDQITYALEASIFVAGAAVQWLRDGVGLVSNAAETELLARSLDSNEGVYFVPALAGLGSPHWDPYARGLIIGLTRGTTRAHIARAALEAMAYQTYDAIAAMEEAAGLSLKELRVDGGPTANKWLMQFQANLLGHPVVVPNMIEATALGAAYLAGVGSGLMTMDQIRNSWQEKARYESQVDDRFKGLLTGWHRALKLAGGWAVDE